MTMAASTATAELAVITWQPRISIAADSRVFSDERPAVDSPLTVRGGRPAITSLSLTRTLPAAVSLAVAAPKLAVSSYRFPLPGGWKAKAKQPPQVSASPPHPPAPLTRTRIKPPTDVIKLEDRLFYVLQPSLEALVGDSSLAFPSHPFDYQFEGVAFLYPRYAAILADEMGLGKTMQAITAIRLLMHTGELGGVLLVCPKPLVTNWQREFAHWAPELPVAAIEGDRARRRWQWQQADMPVKIANYELLQRDREIIAELGLAFDLVLLDEAQRIKNRASATSQCVRALARRRSWALTGTPVENSPQDLIGIFEFLAPGHLSDAMKPRRLGRAAADYVLRRTKDRVLTQLPPKMFRDAEVDLTAAQRASYELAEKEGIVRLTELGTEATIQHVFELVLRLKQICNFDPATGDSSKLERLAADLDEVAASGRKAIVFSQWVTTLEQLAARVDPALKPLLYHGRVAARRRDGVLDEFRGDPTRHLLLLSYGAGGVGLNLQFAEYVFLFDRWWNPAVEDQAINRAHRIGVAGPVTVTRFLTADTIEERIDQILREKRELFDTIFSDVEPTHNLGLTQQEIFGLFRLQCPTGPIAISGQ
jgi:SNF2 family DNA or RNA helicase